MEEGRLQDSRPSLAVIVGAEEMDAHGDGLDDFHGDDFLQRADDRVRCEDGAHGRGRDDLGREGDLNGNDDEHEDCAAPGTLGRTDGLGEVTPGGDDPHARSKKEDV